MLPYLSRLAPRIGLLVFAVLTSACSGMKVIPTRSEFGDTQPRAAQIDVVIDDKDVGSVAYSRFGLIGFVFPEIVAVGDTLQGYAEHYFTHAFAGARTSPAPSAGGSHAKLTIDQFSISAFRKEASLDLTVHLTDHNGTQLLSRSYHGTGEGHFPLYLNEFEQKAQVLTTTRQAFDAVFDQLWADLVSIQVPQ